LVLTALGSAAHAERVDDFTLIDHNGQAHELYYHRNASAVVLAAHSNACSSYDQALQDLHARHTDENVTFLLINSNSADDRQAIKTAAENRGIDIPILDDSTQLIGEGLDLTTAGEVLVVDPKTWKLTYRGNVETAGQAIDAVIAGTEPEQSTSAITGCPVELSRGEHTISYSQTIAPMLREKCAVCHTPGGIGPWAMTDYNMVRGFAPMIREVVRTKRMPPWHADPQVGTWKHDKSLSIEETRNLVHWIEAGAPRGEGEDVLATKPVQYVEWPLGEPDFIVEVPAFEVPATGVVDYQFPRVANPLDHDVWVTAATVVPGARPVVHHVLMGSLEKGKASREGVFDNYIIGYAPGNESALMPDGTGVHVKKGGEFLIQMHYTTSGKAMTDNTRIGLYFADEPPRNYLRNQVILSPRIQIPPHDPAHLETAYVEFYDDAVLHSLVPHSHYRGVASDFVLRYPDGAEEVVLSVPNYDFNWQQTYEFVEPKAVPAGSKLIHRTVYDNSVDNTSNPDPDRTVGWGLQSWDEMLYGNVSFSWVKESSDNPIHDNEKADTAQFFGFMDRDMDGKLVWNELPERLQKRLLQAFKMVDRNGDGGLDLEEFVQMNRMSRQQSAGAR
jgi:peroxiredoxin